MPASTYPYTTWPTADDVLTRLAAAGVTLRAEDPAERIDQVAAAVTGEVLHSTRRQFVPDSEDTTRVFDGNGTAEIVTLTAVTVIGYQANPGYDLADVSLIEESTKPKTRLILARGSVPAWQTQAVLYPQFCFFPAGRQNIRVTGRWGYGAVIPADLWEAVCGEVAARVTAETLFTPAGRLQEEQYGDERRKYALTDGEATGWHNAFAGALARYKRPQGRRLRRLRGEML